MSDARRRVDRDLAAFVDKAMRTLQARAWQILTAESPVLTGYFRSRWEPTTGSFTSIPQKRPPQLDVAVAQARALFGQNAALSAALTASYTVRQGPIFITNPTIYGPFLNQGSSAQAPAMFVERAVQLTVRRSRADLAT